MHGTGDFVIMQKPKKGFLCLVYAQPSIDCYFYCIPFLKRSSLPRCDAHQGPKKKKKNTEINVDCVT